MGNELQIYSNTDIKEMAKYMGPLFGKKPEDMFALMMISQAEGLHPATAAQEYDIIQGKPAINSRAAQSRFQKSGGKIEFLEYTDTKCSARFSHSTGTKITVTWTIDDAKRIGLAGKATWEQYPRQMLKARVVAEGVRACYPACLNGMYTTDEVQDFTPDSRPSNSHTETQKAPEFKPQEPRNVTQELEGEPEPTDDFQDDNFEDDEPAFRTAVTGTLPEVEQWKYALEDIVESRKIIEWASGQSAEIQRAVVDNFQSAQDKQMPEVGVIRSLLLHPAFDGRKLTGTEILVRRHFEDTVLPHNDLSEITSFMRRAHATVFGSGK